MLQNYEDWQAEIPTIILDIPGIQSKDHHTDEELRSLTLEALSVVYPSTTWARAYRGGSTKEAAKNGVRGVFIKLPNGRSTRSLWPQGSSQQTTELKPTPCLQQPRLWTKKRDFLPTVFLTDCRSILQSLQSPKGDQIFSNIRQELSLLKKHLQPYSGSLLTVVLEAMKKQTSFQKWEAGWSNMHTPCPTVKQRPS